MPLTTTTQPKTGFNLQNDSRLLLEFFQKSITKKDPALFLYQSEVRSILFRVEALLRLLELIYKDEPLKEMLKIIKKLEDNFGRIDDQDELHLLFSKSKSVSKAQRNYFLEKKKTAIEKMNEDLLQTEFYQGTFRRLINAFRYDVSSTKFTHLLEKALLREIRSSREFFESRPNGFKNIEDDVHEMRRKLRWISIYGQSLDGRIILEDRKKAYAWEKEFLQKDKIKSPYNQLPVHAELTTQIRMDRKAFFAFNSVIEELGKIKDKGLSRKALKKSIEKTEHKTPKKAKKLTVEELGLTESKKQLLDAAYALMSRFFNTWAIDQQLLTGVSSGESHRI